MPDRPRPHRRIGARSDETADGTIQSQVGGAEPPPLWRRPACSPVALAACGSSGGGRVTLNFYSFNDPSGAVQQAVDECATGNYSHLLQQAAPRGADDQRQQLVRRLAAEDESIDIMGLDVTWAAEFAEAEWIGKWTGEVKRRATEDPASMRPAGDCGGPGRTGCTPSRTTPTPSSGGPPGPRAPPGSQPPSTWDEMLSDAKAMAAKGLPHFVEVQGAQYEGVTVWFNTMVSSAGGSLLNSASSGPGPRAPMVKALTVMKDLASSPAADPSLSVQMEDTNRLGMESGSAAFELNYPFVYPSMQADNPKVKTYNGKPLKDNFKWALYPGVEQGKPAKVTIGGIDLAVSKYSQHPQMAFQAALCLRNGKHQLIAAVKGGLPPTITTLYTNPSKEFVKSYPFYQDVYKALQSASVRPRRPRTRTCRSSSRTRSRHRARSSRRARPTPSAARRSTPSTRRG